MNKGVVLEKHKRFMIVMTNEGEFIKAKLREDVDIGEEIPFSPIQVPKWSTIYQSKKYVSVMAAAILLLVFLPIYQFISPDKAYGLVTVDINPSLEFTVNSNYDVIDAEGYNEDGRTIINGLKDQVIGQPLNVAVSLLITKGNELGYLSNENDIYISSSLTLTEESWGESYERWMEAIQQNYEVNFITINLDNEIFEAAKELSISPTKFVFLRDAQEEGIEIDVEQMKNRSIEDIEADRGKKLDKLISPESIKVNAPFKRGKPENPGNSDHKKNNEKQQEKEEKREEQKEEKEKKNRGNGNNQGSNKSKDDEHPSNKKNENSNKQQNKKEDHPSSKKEKKEKQNQGNNGRQNQNNGNQGQNQNNGNQNQGNNNNN